MRHSRRFGENPKRSFCYDLYRNELPKRVYLYPKWKERISKILHSNFEMIILFETHVLSCEHKSCSSVDLFLFYLCIYEFMCCILRKEELMEGQAVLLLFLSSFYRYFDVLSWDNKVNSHFFNDVLRK